MRPASLYLVQARIADLHQKAQRDAPARSASRARHTRTPRRGYGARGLSGRGGAPRAHRAGRRQPMTAPVTAQTHPAPAAAQAHCPDTQGPGGRTRAAGPPQPRRQETAVNRIRRIRRLAAALAGLAGALLASITTAPTALASQLRPDPPWWLGHRALPAHLPPGPAGFFKHRPVPHHAHVHAALAGGLPGWQIALITAAAAVLAAAAILLARALAARRHPATADS
jgi:hypothetical protein